MNRLNPRKRPRAQRSREREFDVKELLREKKRAKGALRTISDAVIITDAEGNVDYMNPAAETLTGNSFEWTHHRPIHKAVKLIRVGGDEFAPLLHDCPIERAENIIDDLHDKLVRDSIRIEDKRFPIEFSAGTCHGDTQSTRNCTAE